MIASGNYVQCPASRERSMHTLCGVPGQVRVNVDPYNIRFIAKCDIFFHPGPRERGRRGEEREGRERGGQRGGGWREGEIERGRRERDSVFFWVCFF